MKIYIQCNKESRAYRSLIIKALRDAGHEVHYDAEIRNDAHGKAISDVCLDLSLGGLSQLRPELTPVLVSTVSKIDFRIQKLVLVIGHARLPRRAIVDGLHMRQKSRAIFINNYLKPAMAQGLVTMTCPAHPNLPEQAYHLTSKGLDLYTALTKDTH
jgi:hypothetical protein